ncbi:hypothetical protein [Dyadobacter sp. CY312]|uniref:hypothetical protein n=1 Tax=Dyadobacter sp. CY312 TaxID=2907303 RepID=UPI001F425B1D|nr:hypothetical protein [Dyadobacter sp. CY312]MCE7039872.1 hypothetical protein [Dyadobacter sp. CY312]
MRFTKSDRRNIGQIIILLGVMFSLAPCAVKISIFDALDIAYNQPLNKSKTALPASTACPSLLASDLKIETNVLAGKRESRKVWHVKNRDQRFLLPIIASKKAGYSSLTSGNSPPMYILYKRFKSDLSSSVV